MLPKMTLIISGISPGIIFQVQTRVSRIYIVENGCVTVRIFDVILSYLSTITKNI